MARADWTSKRLIETALPGKTGFDDGDWIEAPYITNNGIRLIQTGNIGIGEFIDKPEQQRFISEHTFRTLGCKWVHPGDILLCRLADPIGRACEVPPRVGDSITAVDCTIYRADPGVTHARFALHWFNSHGHLKAAQDVAGGSTRQRISRGNLGSLTLPTPPLPEQRQIAAVLDTLNDTIRKTEQIIAKLKQVKQGLLHDLLTRGIDDNGNLRDPDRHPEQFKDSPLGRIPRPWGVGPLGGFIDRIDAGSSPSCPERPAAGDEWGVLKVSAVRPTGFQPAENKAIVNPAHIEPSFEVRDGDLLITRANTYELVGLTCLVERPPPRLLLSDKTLRLVVAQGVADSRFVFYASQMPFVRRQIETCATGSSGSMKNIAQSAIRMLRLTVPPLAEQKTIADLLVGQNRREDNEVRTASKLRLLKSALMEDLLTGRVRVTPLLEAHPP